LQSWDACAGFLFGSAFTTRSVNFHLTFLLLDVPPRDCFADTQTRPEGPTRLTPGAPSLREGENTRSGRASLGRLEYIFKPPGGDFRGSAQRCRRPARSSPPFWRSSRYALPFEHRMSAIAGREQLLSCFARIRVRRCLGNIPIRLIGQGSQWYIDHAIHRGDAEGRLASGHAMYDFLSVA